jgi:hypothetical protein
MLVGKPESTSESMAGNPGGIQTGSFLNIKFEVTILLSNIM